MRTEQEIRLEEIISRGHGECLEAIKLMPDGEEKKNKLVQYISRHRELGINTKQTRRAIRLLGSLS